MGGPQMSLASPLALLWLAALIPVVVFYILKVRLRRVPVSTVLFWRQIYDEYQPRSIWERMRHWMSLLAQVVLILLLVGALTDPFFAWETRQLRRIVLIVDNSASMNATDVAPSRLAAAKEEALRVIRGMRFGDELAVVTAGGTPRVACGFSSHGRTLADALDDVVSTDNPTRVVAAVELAHRLLGERQDEHRREIGVLTDSGFHRLREDEAPGEPVRQEPPPSVETRLIVHRFGSSVGNVGITQFQVRRSLIDPLGYEILAEVTNASEEPIECRLEIDLNDEVVDVVPLKLTAGQRWNQSFEKASVDGGQLLAKLDRADALATDNRAWAVLPKREMIPVTLVSEGNLFLQKVFESNPLIELTQITPPGGKPLADGRELSSKASASAAAITIFYRQVPGVLPKGAVLVIDPRESCDAWQVGDVLQNPVVHQQDKDSPLLRHVRLDNVVMPEARQLKFTNDEGVKVMAQSVAGDPLLAMIERPAQKVLLLTVNLDEGDLPLRTAFPILMMNALNWCTENRGELRESLPTGSITEIDVAAMDRSRSPLALIAPDGRRSVLPTPSERFSLGPFDQCGVWRVVADDRDATLLELACNLTDRSESDVRVLETDERTEISVVSASLFGNRPVWFWLIALAWLLMSVEWWAYQRRVIS
ncbi:MAG: VWA domain-containing protein [Planctomycetes bacterium]|nr:VWA domain-containing protein [Planctomycetota bacterium]